MREKFKDKKFLRLFDLNLKSKSWKLILQVTNMQSNLLGNSSMSEITMGGNNSSLERSEKGFKSQVI